MFLFIFSLDVCQVAPVAANFHIGALFKMLFKFVLLVRESATEGAMIVSMFTFSCKMSPHNFPISLEVTVRTFKLELLHACVLQLMSSLVLRVEFSSARRTIRVLFRPLVQARSARYVPNHHLSNG